MHERWGGNKSIFVTGIVMAFVDDMQNKNGRKFLSGDLDFFLAGGGHTRKMLDGEMWGSRSGDSAIRDTRMME